MVELRSILGAIAILVIIEPASAYGPKFTARIHPDTITLNCVATQTGTDVWRVPVDDAGQLISGVVQGDNITARVQFVADKIDELRSGGYRRRGNIRTTTNGIRYVELAREYTLTAKMALTIKLTIAADRNGAQVTMTDVDYKDPSLTVDPPISNLITNKSRRIVGEGLERKHQRQLADLRGVVNKFADGHKINYRSSEAVFDTAYKGKIERVIPVSYCGKDRNFRVLIIWDRRIDDALGQGAADW